MKQAGKKVLSKIAAGIALCGLAAGASAQNLVGNGDFSLDPIGTTLSLTNVNANNGTTFHYWGMYSVNSTNMANLTATIVDNPESAGNPALRMVYNRVGLRNITGLEDWSINSGATADRSIPVTYGEAYYLSFDVANMGSSSNLLVYFPEYTGSFAYAGKQWSKTVVVTNTGLTRIVIPWTPQTNSTRRACVAFQPQLTGLGADTNISLLIDNVELVPAGYWLNGGFEAQPLGTAVTKSGAGTLIDNSTISNWRLFTVNATNGTSFGATVVTNTATGGLAVQLDYSQPVAVPQAWGFDRNDSRLPVVYRKGYVLSFDAACVGVPVTLQAVMPEFNSTGAFVGQQAVYNISVTNTTLQRYAYHWSPLNAATVVIGPNFKPFLTGANLTASVILDNIRLTPVSVYNGSFEVDPVGTEAVITNKTETWLNTISTWQVISRGTSPNVDDLTATLVPEASDGDAGMRLDWVRNGGTDTVIQSANPKNPYVVYGVNYNIMIDAAYVSGSPKVSLVLPECNASGTFLGKQVGYTLMVTNTSYQTLTFENWTAQSNATELLWFALRPQVYGTTNSMSILLDNFRMGRAASVSLGGMTRTYDGLPKAPAFTTTPAGLARTPTYTGLRYAPLNAGSYTVTADVSDVSYLAVPATGTLVIEKAAATVTLGNLSQQYDGTPRAPSVTVSPTGLTVDVTYNGSPAAPTAVGSYEAIATVNEQNYAGSVTNTFVITAIPHTILLVR